MRIVSWNVNGLRACAGKGFAAWLDGCGADVVCLQEIRATPEQLPPELVSPPGWHAHYFPAKKLGYSGVGILSRRPADAITTSLGSAEFDDEGRVQIARFGEVTVAGAYFPNGNGKDRDLSRIPYKLAFYRALQAVVQPLADSGAQVVVAGDWNTAPEAIDLARPKDNEQTSGFRPEERAEVRRWLSAGWTDSFRRLHPAATGAYSWWSQRFGVREKNIGWRIDLMLTSPAATANLRAAGIDAHVQGSDHAPCWLELAA